MRPKVETEKNKLLNLLKETTVVRYWLEGTIIRDERQLTVEEVIARIEKHTDTIGKPPRLKFLHGCHYIIFDVNKWIRIER